MRILTENEIRLWKLCSKVFQGEFNELAEICPRDLVIKGMVEALREIEETEHKAKRSYLKT